MREAALQKRRKAAEELLRWHRKLLDEEKKIAELEAAATSVVRKAPDSRYKFNGKQLNQLWRSMTGRDERRFVEEKVYVMSQVALERFCKCARQQKSRKTRNSDSEQSGVGGSEKRAKIVRAEARSIGEVHYSSPFDSESVQEIIDSQEEKTKISSISELIDNFSKIEDEISLISRKSEFDITSLKENVDVEESDKTEIVEDLDTVSQPSTKSSNQPSVQQIMTPNHISEPEETVKTSQDTRTPTKNEVSEKKLSTEIESSVINEREESKMTLSKEEIIRSPEIEVLNAKGTRTVSLEEIKSPETGIEEVIITTIEEETVSPKDTEASSIRDAITTIEEDIEAPGAKETITAASGPEETEVLSDKEAMSVASGFKETKVLSIEEAVTAASGPEETEVLSVEEAVTATSGLEETEVSSVKEAVTGTSAAEETEVSSIKEATVAITDLEKTDVSSVKEATTAGSGPEEAEESSDKEAIAITPAEVTVSTSEEVVPTLEQEAPTEEFSKDFEEIVTEKSPVEDTDKTRASAVISEAIEAPVSSSKDLSLEEALESASKIEESLSKLNEQFVGEKKVAEVASKVDEVSEKLSGEKSVSTLHEVRSLDETSPEASSSKSRSSEEKSLQKKSCGQIDVKKRVSEILADANGPRGDKSPRLQDLYVTAYDVGSANSSEIIEPFEDGGRQLPTDIFGSEAEVLWRKQLAIEQEIKQLEQQQKEQLPYVFMREIPNKPPPPYTPPSSLSASLPRSIVPSSVKELNEISEYSSKVLYKAYLNNNLDKVKFSENGFKLFSKVNVAKICAEFVFNICRDIARDHYKQFEKVEEPSWLVLSKKPQLAKTSPPDAAALDKIMNKKLRELFGFKKMKVAESAIIRWGRKKRDHVDEILVIESQEEESQWTNFDSDELIVKDQITNDIMKMLMDETANIFTKILSKKKSVVG